MATRKCFTFHRGAADRTADPSESLGFKGANLALLAGLDLPVPPGFTISTVAWRESAPAHGELPQALRAEILAMVEWLEGVTGRIFDGEAQPLLLAVRPSARAPMPGLADTLLDIGLNDRTVETLARELGDLDFAFRAYRRFIEGFASLVFSADPAEFEEIADAERSRLGWGGAHEPATPDEWRALIARYHAFIEEELGEALPQTPFEQLLKVVEGCFASWRSPVARAFRAAHAISENSGLAVTVHAMIFNERGEKSGTGHALSRDLSTGKARLTGSFRVGGREYASLIRHEEQVLDLAQAQDDDSFPADLPALADYVARIETHIADACEVDFMVGDGELFLLQSRPARRSVAEGVRVAVEMVRDGLIGEEDALLRVDPMSLDELLHPTIERGEAADVIGRGLPASPGAATGLVAFTGDDAIRLVGEGRPVILVRNETLPEDVHGMHVAEGVLTIRGGTTSHAAVVARGIGKPCVTGAGALRIDMAARTLTAGGITVHEGEAITIDGASGEVILGAARLRRPMLTGDFATLMEFADRARRLGVRTNAETPIEARAARAFGAEGIGLCRTEHMFFEGGRVGVMRDMILAGDAAGRRQALDRLLPMQRSDFVELFEIMAGLPVTIRLLDPPLHEFLPKGDAEIAETAAGLGIAEASLRARIEKLEEFNPMLGHRGCRLAISYPEIVEMQTRAILEAAIEAGGRKGKDVVPEIMVPLVGLRREFDFVKQRIDEIATAVAQEKGRSVSYHVGAMIELPRAIMRADTIAEVSDFFSFGTNDLTQTVYGISRDDAANFLSTYQREGIIERDPFQTLDVEGVGEFIVLGVDKARRTRPDITLGVCGEQGGDPASITFFEQAGLDYVSCSPFRVPIARLAAAQAAIRLERAVRAAAPSKTRGRGPISTGG
ncbi:pyruvate, phosphate dikinase [Aureimonas frigidaquae]|uniref:pyruvate, phosphate dikinase n=1 Tax=Aureimonas frigidaquae TaxID=424757 RepID=UPI0007821404|nr:pyruvate, phosphate dikinase [Aureimonas frigidaquae]